MRFLRFLFFLSALFYVGIVQANDSHVADRRRSARKVLPVPDVMPSQANKETVIRIADGSFFFPQSGSCLGGYKNFTVGKINESGRNF